MLVPVGRLVRPDHLNLIRYYGCSDAGTVIVVPLALHLTVWVRSVPGLVAEWAALKGTVACQLGTEGGIFSVCTGR